MPQLRNSSMHEHVHVLEAFPILPLLPLSSLPYPLIHSLAKSQSYDDGLIDIFTQYGDHLYRFVRHSGSAIGLVQHLQM